MKFSIILSALILLVGSSQVIPLSTDILASTSTEVKVSTSQRVGDAGVKFDTSKFDPNYPQMKAWSEAGVRGGIPDIDSLKVNKVVYPGSKSKDIVNAINSLGPNGGVILLKNGTYDIDECINVPSNVIIKGESRDKTVCIINKKVTEGKGAFNFVRSTKNSGLYNFTIKGGWGTPKENWIVSEEANYELPGNDNVSVLFNGCEDCFIDAVTILNSADFPMRCHGDHNTFRDLHVDGCFNKNGGCHGYFFLMGGHNLVTGCYITHIRHISIQGKNSKYNVLYDNNLAQEISFHSDDGGNNLIENNKIILPPDMPNNKPNMVAIMGPWSYQHSISQKPNFIYKNDCLEKNHNNNRPWSDDSVIYTGPFEVRPDNLYTNFRPLPKDKVPKGGTLYPIILNNNESPSTPDNDTNTPPSTNYRYTENFNSLPGEGWSNISYKGNNNISWKVESKIGTGFIDNSKAIYFGTNKVGLSTTSIKNGINNFSVTCKNMWQPDVPRTIQLLVNGKVVGTKTFKGSEPYTFSVNNIKQSGNIKLELKNISPTVDGSISSVAFDNLKWSPYYEPTQSKTPITTTITPSKDGYLQGSTPFNTSEIRVEKDKRTSYLGFDLSSIKGKITSCKLIMKCGSDPGYGTISTYLNLGKEWSETNISTSTVPQGTTKVGSLNTTYDTNKEYTWQLDVSKLSSNKNFNLILKHENGNDVSFLSRGNSSSPKLVITYVPE